MNAEIYILRDMDTSGRITTSIDGLAVLLKNSGLGVAYKTEMESGDMLNSRKLFDDSEAVKPICLSSALSMVSAVPPRPFESK